MKKYIDEQIIRSIIEKYDKASEYRKVLFGAASFSENTDPTDHFGDYSHQIKYADEDIWTLIEFCRQRINNE